MDAVSAALGGIIVVLIFQSFLDFIFMLAHLDAN